MSNIAVITGGTRGIGRCIAERFSEAGYRVFVTFLRDELAANTLMAKYPALSALQVDGRRADQVNAMRDRVCIEGIPTVLINNAGISGDALFLNGDINGFHEVMATNFGSATNYCDAFVPLISAISVALASYAKLAAKALGIRYGAVHMELIMSDDGPVMIEAGARMHGTITPTLFTRCYANSLLDQLFEVYFGDPKNLKDAVLLAPAVVSDVICVERGICVVNEAQISRLLSTLKTLKGYSCLIGEGDEYVVTRDLFSSPMNACFCDADRDQLWDDVVAFDEIAQRLMGGVRLSNEGWFYIRSIYEAYLRST